MKNRWIIVIALVVFFVVSALIQGIALLYLGAFNPATFMPPAGEITITGFSAFQINRTETTFTKDGVFTLKGENYLDKEIKITSVKATYKKSTKSSTKSGDVLKQGDSFTYVIKDLPTETKGKSFVIDVEINYEYNIESSLEYESSGIVYGIVS